MSHPINDPRTSAELVRAFELKGSLPLQIDDHVIPVVVAADLVGAPALIRRASGSMLSTAGGAGQFGVFQFVTPPGILARIHKLALVANAAGSYTIQIVTTATLATPANAQNTGFTDGRLLSEGQTPACTMLTGTDVPVALSSVTRLRVVANEMLVLDDLGWVVGGPAGGFIEGQFDQANTLFDGTMLWDEWQLL